MSDSGTLYRLDISIRLNTIDPAYRGPMSQGVEVREQADLNLHSFMEVAQVLGRFHELTEAMRIDPHAQPVWPAREGRNVG